MIFLPLKIGKLYLTAEHKVVRMEYLCHVTNSFIYTEYPNQMYEVKTGKGSTRKQDIIAEVTEEHYNKFIKQILRYNNESTIKHTEFRKN